MTTMTMTIFYTITAAATTAVTASSGGSTRQSQKYCIPEMIVNSLFERCSRYYPHRHH